MSPERRYTPPEASVTDLQAHLSSIEMTRVVLVQPSIYGTDNRCLLDGLSRIGPRARGIAVVPTTITDQAMQDLMRQGVRGVRVNLESSVNRDPDAAKVALLDAARRLPTTGMHLQIYASLSIIAAVVEEIEKLPVPVVLDHFGMPRAALAVDQPGFDAVLGLVRSKKAYVKLSAPYRISSMAPDYEDVLPIAQALIAAGPDRMLWASDWPHTSRTPGMAPTEVSDFRRVDDPAVLNLLAAWAPDAEVRRKILVDNPARLYGF